MLDSSGKVLKFVQPVVHQGEAHGHPYPLRWDDVGIPPSRLGTFEYAIELNFGTGWFSVDTSTTGNGLLRSGEHVRLPVISPESRVEVRLVTRAWSISPDELRGVHRQHLQAYFESDIPGVRQSAFDALTRLGR